eukprot:COSAG01_NODE_4411_length_5051_cov_3.166397_1_plen_81_part_00
MDGAASCLSRLAARLGQTDIAVSGMHWGALWILSIIERMGEGCYTVLYYGCTSLRWGRVDSLMARLSVEDLRPKQKFQHL